MKGYVLLLLLAVAFASATIQGLGPASQAEETAGLLQQRLDRMEALVAGTDVE